MLLRGKIFAFPLTRSSSVFSVPSAAKDFDLPISAMTRDYGDFGDPT
jgi:hypothetical protein